MGRNALFYTCTVYVLPPVCMPLRREREREKTRERVNAGHEFAANAGNDDDDEEVDEKAARWWFEACTVVLDEISPRT